MEKLIKEAKILLSIQYGSEDAQDLSSVMRKLLCLIEELNDSLQKQINRTKNLLPVYSAREQKWEELDKAFMLYKHTLSMDDWERIQKIREELGLNET